jgi:hypothetical protein
MATIEIELNQDIGPLLDAWDSTPKGNPTAREFALEEARRLGRVLEEYCMEKPLTYDIPEQQAANRFRRLRALFGEEVDAAFAAGSRSIYPD